MGVMDTVPQRQAPRFRRPRPDASAQTGVAVDGPSLTEAAPAAGAARRCAPGFANGPTVPDLLWPTLKALERSGGSASNMEIFKAVVDIMELSDAAMEIPHMSRGQYVEHEVEYRSRWARTRLKNVGMIENSEKCVWALTSSGRQMLQSGSDALVRRTVEDAMADSPARQRPRGRTNGGAGAAVSGQEELMEEEPSWEDRLLAVLQTLDGSAFERLCQRLLRESGFSKVEVTGRAGDGGIDGAGILRVNLLSFHVRFQCKRYANAVSAGHIRDFRGAIAGRADKGLFITTGRFTKDAEREATRDGASPIDLVDGAELCRLLKQLGLGVATRTETVVQPEFFAGI